VCPKNKNVPKKQNSVSMRVCQEGRIVRPGRVHVCLGRKRVWLGRKGTLETAAAGAFAASLAASTQETTMVTQPRMSGVTWPIPRTDRRKEFNSGSNVVHVAFRADLHNRSSRRLGCRLMDCG